MRHAHAPLSAIGLVVAATLLFTTLDTTVKYLSSHYPVALLVWVRYGIQGLTMLAVLTPRMRGALFATSNPRLMIVRGTTLLLSSVCFFSALRFLPIAEATAINYSTPVIVTLIAGWHLRERITRPRRAFVAAGIVGMLLIVRPGSELLTPPALFAFGAAIFYATFQILTRKLASEDTIVLLFYPAICGTVLATAAVPFFDTEASFRPRDVALMLLIGFCGTVGHFLFILAFQRAQASAITPFTYMQLVWSTIAGWLVFDTFPDALGLAGMLVIAGSGVTLTWYERWRATIPESEPAGVD